MRKRFQKNGKKNIINTKFNSSNMLWLSVLFHYVYVCVHNFFSTKMCFFFRFPSGWLVNNFFFTTKWKGWVSFKITIKWHKIKFNNDFKPTTCLLCCCYCCDPYMIWWFSNNDCLREKNFTSDANELLHFLFCKLFYGVLNICLRFLLLFDLLYLIDPFCFSFIVNLIEISIG